MHNSTVNNFIWKYLERCTYQGTLVIFNIILARLLEPEFFGELAIIMAFINLAQSFVQNGLSTALIRENEISNVDCINLIFANLLLASILYFFIYLIAPFIECFYLIQGLSRNIRIMGLVLFPGGINSVQNAIIVREGKYKSLLGVSFLCALISGIIGVLLAVNNYGVISLIVQQIILQVLLCIIMFSIVKIKISRPKLGWKFYLMLKFGIRIMLSGFLNALYNDIQTFVIGKKYTNEELGYYQQGNNYPRFIHQNINSTISTVILPQFARTNSLVEIKNSMKRTIICVTFILFPIYFGLCGIATNLIKVLLTEKWISCTPYVVLFSMIYATYPIAIINLQAYSAIGRSDIYMKNEVIKKIIAISVLSLFIYICHSPIYIMIGMLVNAILSVAIDCYKAQECFDYSGIEQLKDYVPNFFAAFFMMVVVLLIGKFSIPTFLLLFFQIICGILFYFFYSKLFHLKGYQLVLDILKKIIKV